MFYIFYSNFQTLKKIPKGSYDIKIFDSPFDLEIEINGASQVIEKTRGDDRVVTFYLMPPSLKKLEERQYYYITTFNFVNTFFNFLRLTDQELLNQYSYQQVLLKQM